MLLASTVSANTVEQAAELFASRSNDAAGVENAAKAADIYKTLAENASSKEEKARMKIKESEAIYFVGNRVGGKDNILSKFKRGYVAADFAAKTLAGAEKATALYWYAANQGRWGETNGVLSSLSRWNGEMKPALEKVVGMGQEAQAVEHFGPLRIFGKALLKVPSLSSKPKKQGLEYLKTAYYGTTTTLEVDGEEIEISSQVNNVIFYIWGLGKRKKTDEFCELYDNAQILFDAGEEALMEYDPKSFPETQKEFTDFFEGKGEWEDSVNYYDENC